LLARERESKIKPVNFFELKKKLENFPKYPGTVVVKPGPMINEGYPSNFNLSFAYYEWTREEGQTGPSKQYISFAGEMFYTKCQPCIRPQDWRSVVENGENKYRYLSYFHMADISGLIARMDSKYRKEIGVFAIQSLINFFKELNLDLNNIFVAYCAGGKVVDLTHGKYTFDKEVGKDPFFDEWLKAGISEGNMIPDKTRDTLLSLRNYSRPSPWGYRNEIFYKHQGKLLDIATIEHLCFEPVFDEKMNTIDINDYRHAFSISATGVERLLMVLNDLDDVRKVDIVSPLYDLVNSQIEAIDPSDADILVQTIRPIQAIIADGGLWKTLNSRRKEIARAFYMEFANILNKYNLVIDDKIITDLFLLNADLLKEDRYKNAIPTIMAELKERIVSLGNNKDLPIEVRENYKKILESKDGF
jgi:hypothetical protein